MKKNLPTLERGEQRVRSEKKTIPDIRECTNETDQHISEWAKVDETNVIKTKTQQTDKSMP